ncbi:hypothetical protein K437DRAFT_147351 [Tilletiaria anomala UBC 951]|uniref:Secreted protein n=1 Tax=Tilletiaria anomala (strain ATCC 24038 / CBS 436.72 / UBC 951) TaxID=1037660 RepID=A0A066VPJ7_TILAU|nr:uncharacterized protein K437DRAFT_147351 [Tilletiaria anomala UBC 951]KDN43677.1 hypothetical protein K437DRAFT_147351 [Tilletiaria anomala UBC 951]
MASHHWLSVLPLSPLLIVEAPLFKRAWATLVPARLMRCRVRSLTDKPYRQLLYPPQKAYFLSTCRNGVLVCSRSKHTKALSRFGPGMTQTSCRRRH